jgi:outer membrane beta-barrel protein
MKKGLLKIITLSLTLLVSKQVFAQSSGSDKLDLKKLEDKYWAAKDTDFSVVQNRTYTKDKRFFLSYSYGPLVNDAYSYGRMTNVATGYYFSERWGMEFAYEMGSLKKNDSVLALEQFNGLRPNYNKFVDYKSLNFIWVPFYSKTSFVDRSIMYFDMQFALGLGQMTYEMQSDEAQIAPTKKTSMGYNFDFTQQLFFSRHFAIRLDIKNKWSKQDLQRYRLNAGEPETARALSTTNQQDTTILLGITYFLGGNKD